MTAVTPELDLKRLAELQELLGTELPDIVATLVEELTTAFEAIDAGLAGDDLGATAMAAHAARNSALMIDAQPLLAHLAELESAARAHDMAGTIAAHGPLCVAWTQLRQRLELAAAGRR